MRVNWPLLTVIVVLFATINSVPATEDASTVSAKIDSARSTKRLLRLVDSETVGDEDLKGEERVLPKLDRVLDLTDGTTKGVVKVTRTKSLSSVTPEEELAVWKSFYSSIKAQYTSVFKDFATVQKLDPKQAAEKWGIWQKLKTMWMDELIHDPLYLFWVKYKKYWDKNLQLLSEADSFTALSMSSIIHISRLA